MRTVQWRIGLTMLSWIPCACGPSYTLDDASAKLNELPEVYAKSVCKAVNNCTPQFSEIFFGPNDCVTLIAQRIEQASLPLIKVAVKAGTMEFNPSKLDACMSQIEELGCTAFDNEYLQACEDALGGTVPIRGKCAYDDECEGDAYCYYDGSCPGTCTTRELSGGPCRDDKECRTGLKCFEGQCTAKIARGANCTAKGVGCQSGHLCGLDSGSGRNCVALDEVFNGALDESCDIVTGAWCQAGTYCAVTSVALNSSTQTCLERAESGGACRFSVGDMCPKDEYCEGTVISASDEVQIEGTCHLLPIDGQACTNKIDLGKACAKDHACVASDEGSICRKLRKNGAACDDNAECYSESCVGHVCTPKADCEVESLG